MVRAPRRDRSSLTFDLTELGGMCPVTEITFTTHGRGDLGATGVREPFHMIAKVFLELRCVGVDNEFFVWG